MTPWDEYNNIDFKKFKKQLILDTSSLYVDSDFSILGHVYKVIGKKLIMNREFKIAIIGTGLQAHRRASAIKGFKNQSIEFVASNSEERGKNFAKAYNIKTIWNETNTNKSRY